MSRNLDCVCILSVILLCSNNCEYFVSNYFWIMMPYENPTSVQEFEVKSANVLWQICPRISIHSVSFFFCHSHQCSQEFPCDLHKLWDCKQWGKFHKVLSDSERKKESIRLRKPIILLFKLHGDWICCSCSCSQSVHNTKVTLLPLLFTPFPLPHPVCLLR